MRRLAALLALLAALAACSPLPRCEEDQTLVGRGEFTDGRWSAYVCGPAVDDIERD